MTWRPTFAWLTAALLLSGCPKDVPPDPTANGGESAGGSNTGASGTGANGTGASGAGANGAGGSGGGSNACILDQSQLDDCVLQ